VGVSVIRTVGETPAATHRYGRLHIPARCGHNA